jgi:hypothetical protein
MVGIITLTQFIFMPANKKNTTPINFEDFFYEDLKNHLNLPLAIDYAIGEKTTGNKSEKTLEITFRTQNLRLIENLFKDFPIKSTTSYAYRSYNDPGISDDQKPSETVPLFTKVTFNYSDLEKYFGKDVNEKTIENLDNKISKIRNNFIKNIFLHTLNFDSESNLKISKNKQSKNIDIKNFSSEDHYNLAKNFFTFLDNFFDKYKIEKPENAVIFDDKNKTISLSNDFYKLISNGKFKATSDEKITIIGRLVNLQHSYINEQFAATLNQNGKYNITTIGDKQKIYNLEPESILETKLEILYKEFSEGKKFEKENHFQIVNHVKNNDIFLSKEFTNYICRNSSKFSEFDKISKNKNYLEGVLGVKIQENDGFVVINTIPDDKKLLLNHVFNSCYFSVIDGKIPFSSAEQFTRGKEGNDLHIKTNFLDKTTSLTMSKRFFDEVLNNSNLLEGFIKEWNEISKKISPELGGALVK